MKKLSDVPGMIIAVLTVAYWVYVGYCWLHPEIGIPIE